MDTETVPDDEARPGPSRPLGKRSTAMDAVRGVNLDGKTAVVTGAQFETRGDAMLKLAAMTKKTGADAP